MCYLADNRTGASKTLSSALLVAGVVSMALLAAYVDHASFPGASVLVLVVAVAASAVAATVPEVAFALFLVAGFFKADPRIGLPAYADLTVLFGMVALGGIIIKVLRRGFRIPRVPSGLLLPYFGLVVMMAGSLFYTGAPSYGADKVVRFSTITALATFGPLFLLREPNRLERFLYTLVALSTAMVFDSYFGASGPYRTAFGSNYLALGRITGITSILAFYYVIARPKLRGRLFWMALGILNLFGLLSAGARGPATALILTVGIVVLSSVKLRPRRTDLTIMNTILTAVLIVGLLFFFYGNAFSTLVSRTRVLFSKGHGVSAGRRLQLFGEAVDAIAASPLFGHGVGGFSTYAQGSDARLYPHNLFLEAGSELGIVGVGFLLALLIASVLRLLKLRRTGADSGYLLSTAVLALFVFMLANAFVSGDLNDNRLLFVWLGVTHSLGLRR